MTLTIKENLTPAFDHEINALTHEQAIGVIRTLVFGEWIEPNAVRLAMRVQIRAVPNDSDH